MGSLSAKGGRGAPAGQEEIGGLAELALVVVIVDTEGQRRRGREQPVSVCGQRGGCVGIREAVERCRACAREVSVSNIVLIVFLLLPSCPHDTYIGDLNSLAMYCMPAHILYTTCLHPPSRGYGPQQIVGDNPHTDVNGGRLPLLLRHLLGIGQVPGQVMGAEFTSEQPGQGKGGP